MSYFWKNYEKFAVRASAFFKIIHALLSNAQIFITFI